MSTPSTSSSSKLRIELRSPTLSSATLGRSQLQSSNSLSSTTTFSITATSTTTSLHQLEGFIEQDMFDDGTIHSRVPEHEVHFDEDSCVPFYEARAHAAIAQFEIAFAGVDEER